MLIFNEESFEEIPATLVKPYQIKVSKPFIEKHGIGKTREVARKAMLYLRDSDLAVHSFMEGHTYSSPVDGAAAEKLRSIASMRGMSISALVREALHDHFLNKVEPVRQKREVKSGVSLYMSPFERKLLKHWCEKWDCTMPAYFSTLAAVLEPMEEPDLVALRPVQHVPLYPTEVLREKFDHNVRVYGYEGGVFIRQILAFLDRPFNPKRVEDRYLDWLTHGYASALRA